MYLGSKPRRRSLRLTIILLLLILIAILFVHFIITRQPDWSQPFEPSPTPTRSAQSYIAEGEAFYGEGRMDKAIQAYQQALVVSPDNALAHTRLAHFLILRERTAEAEQHARQAVLLEPSNPQTLAALCRASDWEGKYSQAFDACECAIELAPDYAEAYAYLAEVYADTGNWYSSREYSQQAIDLDYQSMDAHRNRGYVLEMQGRFKEAAEAYDNAIVLHSNLAPLYLDAGRVYRGLGQFDQAIDRLEKVIRLDPDNPIGYDQLGWTYYTAGEYDRAVEHLEEATLVDPEYTQAWGHLGITNYVLQQYEDAIQDFQRAIELSEKDYEKRARRIVIVASDTNYDPPRTSDLMYGDWLPLYRQGVGTLDAELLPETERRRHTVGSDQTCGDLIAWELSADLPDTGEVTLPQPETTGTPEPVDPLQDARGSATMDLETGQISLELKNLPQPEGVPYEVMLEIWPGKRESLGYFTPDGQGNAGLQFVFDFKNKYPAPVEYYYTLGFSYVHLEQCDKGIPWLRDSLEIDSSAYNPAWQGLASCDEIAAEDMPTEMLEGEEEATPEETEEPDSPQPDSAQPSPSPSAPAQE